MSTEAAAEGMGVVAAVAEIVEAAEVVVAEAAAEVAAALVATVPSTVAAESAARARDPVVAMASATRGGGRTRVASWSAFRAWRRCMAASLACRSSTANAATVHVRRREGMRCCYV